MTDDARPRRAAGGAARLVAVFAVVLALAAAAVAAAEGAAHGSGAAAVVAAEAAVRRAEHSSAADAPASAAARGGAVVANADLSGEQAGGRGHRQRQGVVRPVPGRVVRAFAPPATRYGPGHRGVDLAAEPGDAVRAAMAGTITFSGTVARVGWVTVDHGGGLRTTYGPLDPRSVRAGQRVATGAQLGRLADRAAHLDWGALLHGVYIDPMSLLGRWEVHLVRPARHSG